MIETARFQQTFVADIVGGLLFSPCFLDLIVAPPVPSRDRPLLTAAQIPTYSGYIQSSLSFPYTGAQMRPPGGPAYGSSDGMTFTGPNSGPGVNVIGWVAWTGSLPGPYNVKAAGEFPHAISLKSPLDLLTLMFVAYYHGGGTVFIIH